MIGDIREATRWLETTLRPDPGDERRLMDAVLPLSERTQLAVLVRSLLADRQLTTAAAAESYPHPLGFDRLVLTPHDDLDFQLRLHVWWPGRQDIIEDVHNHRFPFASTVLDGALEMQILERAAEGISMREFDSTSAGRVGTSRFRHVGDVRLSVTFAARVPTGTTYCMSAPALHRITGTDGGLTATLFLRGIAVQPTSAVLSGDSASQRPTVARPTMAPRSFCERMTAYVETLEASLAP